MKLFLKNTDSTSWHIKEPENYINSKQLDSICKQIDKSQLMAIENTKAVKNICNWKGF